MNFQNQMIIIFLFVCSACVTKKEFIKNEHLINYRYVFFKEDGEEMNNYFENREIFIKNYTSAKYTNDTLVATTLIDLDPCSEYKGNIRFSNDTLYLLQYVVEGDYCSSTEFYKFEYTIVKKNIEKYYIVF